MTNFRDLKVWNKSHELTLAAYKDTARFPAAELYGLTSQIRRSASSIPANISEGCGRASDADFARFLHQALGSANELDYHLLLARDLAYLPANSHQTLALSVLEVQKMLATFITKLKARG